MSAADRSRALAAELARRAIAAAEANRQPEPNPTELTERLRSAADGEGRLTVDEAVEALTAEPSKANLFADYQAQRLTAEAPPPGSNDEPEMNDVIRQELDRREQAKRELLFPSAEPDEHETTTDEENDQ